MLIFFTLFTFSACGQNELEEEPKEEKSGVTCQQACEMYHKDPRTGPSFVKFHYKKAAEPEYDKCYNDAIVEGRTPKEKKCDQVAISKCEASCKKMKDGQKKKKRRR